MRGAAFGLLTLAQRRRALPVCEHIVLASRRFAMRKAAFMRLASRLMAGSNGNGQVRFLSAPAVSSMKAWIASTATRDATSPATCPPMPSATRYSPMSPRVQ